ncbi:MAG: hypothetical protein H8E12_06255 [Rhodobacteraceae bacterium]|nr:hypothetical protein [Paracoccaceae bacterium]
MIRVHELGHLPQEAQEALLSTYIRHSERGWLFDCLRQFNVPRRTAIYKLFGWNYQWTLTTQEERNEAIITKEQAIRTLLEHSSINDWINMYLSWYTVPRFIHSTTTALGEQVIGTATHPHLTISIRD